MRINEKQFIQADKGERAAENKKAEAKRAAKAISESGASTSAAAADSVALSGRARDVAEIASQLKDSSEVREELVSELREKIRSGEYHVSGLDIAGKIVDKAQEGIF